jgi:thiamine kinase
LCHGDLHPGNAIVTGDEAAIVDWSAATRGEPAADFARSLLLLRWAEPLPGTPMVLRVLMAAARSLYADEFARAYRSANSETSRDLDSWTVVHAAARLAEGITSERARLVGMVESAYHRRR